MRDGQGRVHAISVVHLVWRPLGPAVLAQFVAAYRRHAAGVPHQLVVVYNGFAGSADRAPYEDLLAGVEHQPLVLPRPVQDLPAYRAAARALAGEYVCFLNSYSEPLAPGWLAHLHAHAARPGVGLVGASGSWESHASIVARLLRLNGRGPRALAVYAYGWAHVQRAARMYDPFPNHHVRTNGFMLRRELMLALRWPAIRTKADALAFESGRAGLTRQVEARGLGVLVVGRDGRGYAPADWWRSGTYRCGDQQNLLIADNRTRQFGNFDTLDPTTKAGVVVNTWGPDPVVSARALARPAALARRRAP